LLASFDIPENIINVLDFVGIFFLLKSKIIN